MWTLLRRDNSPTPAGVRNKIPQTSSPLAGGGIGGGVIEHVSLKG